jgi:alpha-galactosidase/6-phospho-beta-glucosidase family protein
MSRRLNIYTVLDGKIINITWHVANVLEYRYNQEKESMVVGGCGMDMGYHIVYSLSRVLGVHTTYQEEDTDGLRGDCYGLNHRWL